MIYWEVAEDCRGVLEAMALNGFDRLMSAPLGELLDGDGTGRELRRIANPAEHGPRHLYLKRIGPEPLGGLLRMLVFGRLPRCGPLREKMLIDALTAAGLPVMRPVAWGEERRFGLPTRGFLLVEEVAGTELGELFAVLKTADRHRLLADFGSFVRRLHQAGFFQPVRFKDVFCTIQRERYGFTLIDRETSKPWPARFGWRRSVKSLARAYRRTVRDGYRLTTGDARCFIRGFFSGFSGPPPVSPRTFRHWLYRGIKKEFNRS